jgi:hypothetical protein
MLSFLKAGWALITANPWRAAAVALVLAISVQAVRLELAQRSLVAEREGRRADRTEFERATAEAIAGHTATARAVEQAQAAVSAGVSQDVQNRLDRIGAGVDRLRRQAAEGHSAPAYLPGTADATPRTDRAVEGDGLLRVDPAVIGECQRNTEIALGWQMWWQDMKELRPQ